MTKIFSPLEHFELNIFTYIYLNFYDFSITSALIYLLSLLGFLIFLLLSMKKISLVPNKAQIVWEGLYNFLLTIFKQQINSPRALRWFPLIVTLFFFILIMNYTSLFVYGVSLTGHIIITAILAFSIFISLFIYAILNYGLSFHKFFVPSGVPKVLLDFIILIEIFSFAIRPFSLSIRLFANMLAGHTLLGIFAQFSAFVFSNYIFLFLLPLFLLFAVFLLELAVAAIQAYIFVSLICIYINDILNLH